MNDILTKVCTKCKQEKPVTEFRKSDNYIRNSCIKCTNEQANKTVKLYQQRLKESPAPFNLNPDMKKVFSSDVSTIEE